METTIKTLFNFAKEIQCNFITKNNPEHSYPGGLPEFITPYLQELQENTIIPDYTTLISITTIDNPDQDGIHILTFLKNDPEHFDDDDTASITCIESLRVLLLESLILILFKALSKTLSKISNQTIITKS